jgi:hypothetical protein
MVRLNMVDEPLCEGPQRRGGLTLNNPNFTFSAVSQAASICRATLGLPCFVLL